MDKKKPPMLSEEKIEQMFRWIRESILLMYSHHKHPVPMTNLIFAYMETFGKALGGCNTIDKVKKFVETYMYGLCNALKEKKLNFDSKVHFNDNFYDIKEVFGNFYRNGLVHQFWMKKGSALFEIKHSFKDRKVPLKYLWIKEKNKEKHFIGINIDFLVPDFLNAIAEYQFKIMSNDNEKENLSDIIE